ncbi:hypothetical protein B0H16DRAFT_1714170 [Mycena metata]|uniref:Uncharacterized protein n=1 Tax=Mycena metata TaxID=1033252 RepID=A0AAD7NS53_9AGAR|nr:hypothetical protein B0H16DRAFT_1714170 [Mycena metata]
MSISGSLWRTGSSLAVYAFRAAQFAPYRPLARDTILASILFAPKHGPLSVEGMVHATGNLPKDSWACIIGRPGEGLPRLTELGVPHLPGPAWVDDGQSDALGKWDVVCRIARMGPIRNWDYRDELIRWHREPTEVLSVVAHSAVASSSTTDPIVHPSHVAQLVQAAIEASTDKSPDSRVHIPIRILLTHTERVVVVHVPVHRSTMAVFSPLETAYDRYRETFNDVGLSKKLTRMAVEPEVSLEPLTQLPTGRVLDTISLPGGMTFDVSVIQPLPGHVSIIVNQDSVPLPDPTLDGITMHLPDAYTQSYPTLASILLDVRDTVLSTFPLLQDAASIPTICLVGPMEHGGCSTVDNRYLCSCQADLCARVLDDSGQWDYSLPEPVLLALSVAQGLENSVAYTMWLRSQAPMSRCGGGRQDRVYELLGGETVSLFVAHPSGTCEAEARFSDTDKGRRATSVRLKKTLFELMRGEFFFPPSVITYTGRPEYDENEDYELTILYGRPDSTSPS